MDNIIYKFIFFCITIYILFKAIGYGLYELRDIKNKVGGIFIIVFSISVIAFSNYIAFIR